MLVGAQVAFCTMLLIPAGLLSRALYAAHTSSILDLITATWTWSRSIFVVPGTRTVTWHAFVDALFRTDWVVYVKPAFGGAAAVLRYLGRYTHRVAISNHRLIAFDGERITFHWKDYTRDGQRRTMMLTAMEFLRRFVQHVLPRGFVRIRQFGFLANHCRSARLTLARRLLRQPSSQRNAPAATPTWSCPRCGAPMMVGPILNAHQLARVCLGFDTS
jgi:hypothetical protein